MTVFDILKDTNYKSAQFPAEAIDRLNVRIEETVDIKGKRSAKTKCLVRNKDIALKPEEVIRQLFLDSLINEYGYPVSRMQIE